MKLCCLILVCFFPLLCHTYPPTEEKSIAVDIDDVAELDSDPSESSKDSQIQKRSGSFDYVTHLKSGLLSSIGHASASIVSGSSGGSSGGGGSYKSHDSGHHGISVGYDPWSFKKSVLNTIFQAVKAITGGVTALKGQFIKGSGYALSASGNLVAASGDKVTDVGKSIIHSAQVSTHPVYGHSGGGGSVHPFAKFSSLSGASSGSSSGGSKHPASPGPVVHAETITTYEIPASGHGSYGPPSKPPSYNGATHQYLPSPPSNSYGGAVPFSGGHAAFEAPSSNYLPSGYGQDGRDDFNIYGQHKKLTEDEARRAAIQLQEILNMRPNGKTEYTASKTFTLDTSLIPEANEINPDNVSVFNSGLSSNLGPLESFSHTESITAAYGAPPQDNPSDIYHLMAKKKLAEHIYVQENPKEGYDYEPAQQYGGSFKKYNNYHVSKGNRALQDLGPIIAALEVVKQKEPAINQPVSTQFAIAKTIHKTSPPDAKQLNLLPQVQKSKYAYFNPAQSRVSPRSNYAKTVERKIDAHYDGSVAPVYKPRRYVAAPSPSKHHKRDLPLLFRQQDYQIQDPFLFNSMFVP